MLLLRDVRDSPEENQSLLVSGEQAQASGNGFEYRGAETSSQIYHIQQCQRCFMLFLHLLSYIPSYN